MRQCGTCANRKSIRLALGSFGSETARYYHRAFTAA
jgi:hypothetical protein